MKMPAQRWIDRLWMLMMMPGIVLAILVAFQVDADALLANPLFDRPATFLGVIGGVLALSMRWHQIWCYW